MIHPTTGAKIIYGARMRLFMLFLGFKHNPPVFLFSGTSLGIIPKERSRPNPFLYSPGRVYVEKLYFKFFNILFSIIKFIDDNTKGEFCIIVYASIDQSILAVNKINFVIMPFLLTANML